MSKIRLRGTADGLDVVPHQVRFTEEGLEGRQVKERVKRAFGEQWEARTGLRYGPCSRNRVDMAENEWET
jgi:hypothetical protein